jgi:hypothetical protein
MYLFFPKHLQTKYNLFTRSSNNVIILWFVSQPCLFLSRGCTYIGFVGKHSYRLYNTLLFEYIVWIQIAYRFAVYMYGIVYLWLKGCKRVLRHYECVCVGGSDVFGWRTVCSLLISQCRWVLQGLSVCVGMNECVGSVQPLTLCSDVLRSYDPMALKTNNAIWSESKNYIDLKLCKSSYLFSTGEQPDLSLSVSFSLILCNYQSRREPSLP